MARIIAVVALAGRRFGVLVFSVERLDYIEESVKPIPGPLFEVQEGEGG